MPDKVQMIIHWRVDCADKGTRTGTCLPDKGESWAHMITFLKQSSPNGFLTAYVLAVCGDELDFHEFELCEDITHAKTWFDYDYAEACERYHQSCWETYCLDRVAPLG